MRTETWMLRASCRGQDPAIWFERQHLQTALAICAECAVRGPCRAYSRREKLEYGVWGGRNTGNLLVVGSTSPGRTRRRRGRVSDNIKWVHGTDFTDAVGGDDGFTLIELPKGVSATRYAGWLDIKKRGRLSGIPSGRRELVSQGAAADRLAVTVSPGESQAYKSEHNMKGSRAQVFALLG